MVSTSVLEYDSKEELYFSWWLSELTGKGFIDDEIYQPESLVLTDGFKREYTKRTQLKTKVRVETKPITVHKGAVYTPDWSISFKPFFVSQCSPTISSIDSPHWPCKSPVFVLSRGGKWVVDIKGEHTGRGHGDGRYFSLCQKLVREKYGVWPQKIEISNKEGSWFDKTFTPRRYLKTDKSGKARTLKYEPRSVEDFLKRFFL